MTKLRICCPQCAAEYQIPSDYFDGGECYMHCSNCSAQWVYKQLKVAPASQLTGQDQENDDHLAG